MKRFFNKKQLTRLTLSSFFATNCIAFFLLKETFRSIYLCFCIFSVFILFYALYKIIFNEMGVFVDDEKITINKFYYDKLIFFKKIVSIEKVSFNLSKSSHFKIHVKNSLPIIISSYQFKNEQDYCNVYEAIRAKVASSNGANLSKTNQMSILDSLGNTPCTTFLCFLILIVFLFFNVFSQEKFFSYGEMLGFSKNVFISEEYYRFFTSQFIHIDAYHLFLNLICIGFLGGMLEPLLGAFKFLNIVIFSAIFECLFSGWFSNFDMVVGASGWIMGLIGVQALMYFRRNLGDLHSIYIMPSKVILLLLLSQVVSDFLIKNSSFSSHLGGFFGGALYFYGSSLIKENKYFNDKNICFFLIAIILSSLLKLLF